MSRSYPAIIKNYPHFLHGGDYNPDQWLGYPGVIDEDFRLMKLAGCNTFSVGIFSWASYEPEDGRFTFDWLDSIMDRMAKAGSMVFLATPSGSKPAWLSKAYPETCRVLENGLREHHTGRHNHCYSSPVYRDKVAIINELLAKRYAAHPALGGWHISNEYSGRCYCNLCMDAFREWLKKKHHSLEGLNDAWWTTFWSHRFTAWEQIDPRDGSLDGMGLDWNRFVTHMTCDFMKHEVACVRKWAPDILVTTNMMGSYDGLDYWKIAEVCDRVADDSYPQFLDPADNYDTFSYTGMLHDIHRSMKGGKPFILMESCPSASSWQPVYKVKRPGIHQMEMLQAVGHGADATMYFQWRKGRGGCEKFHGAVVDHEGSERGRIFQDVAAWGEKAKMLAPIVGTSVQPTVALIYDWEVRWALDLSGGPSNNKKEYVVTCHRHYKPFWSQGIPLDVIDSSSDFTNYKLVTAPLLYMLKEGVASRLRRFVEDGGTLVLTYLSGIVNQSNRCFTGGWPGQGLRELCGVWAEEFDSICDADVQSVRMVADNRLGLSGSYHVKDYCMLVHAEQAKTLGTFGEDFYAGRPAITVNKRGKGEVYYIAARTDDRFLSDFYRAVCKSQDILSPFPGAIPENMTVQMRTDGKRNYFFLLNPTNEVKTVPVTEPLVDLFTGEKIDTALILKANDSTVLTANAQDDRH